MSAPRTADSDVCEHGVPLVDYCRTCEQAMPSDTVEKVAPWRPDDHPPHSWPIGNPAGWRDGYGCPTIECKGEGPRRVTPPAETGKVRP